MMSQRVLKSALVLGEAQRPRQRLLTHQIVQKLQTQAIIIIIMAHCHSTEVLTKTRFVLRQARQLVFKILSSSL